MATTSNPAPVVTLSILFIDALVQSNDPTRKGSFLIHILPKNELTYNPMEWRVVKNV